MESHRHDRPVSGEAANGEAKRNLHKTSTVAKSEKGWAILFRVWYYNAGNLAYIAIAC